MRAWLRQPASIAIVTWAAVQLLLVTGCGALPQGRGASLEQWAFADPSDARSAESIRAHGAGLDGLVLDQIVLDTLTLLPIGALSALTSVPPPARTRRLALVTTFQGARYHSDLVRRLAGDSIALSASAAAVTERLRLGGARGVILDFQEMTSRDSALTRAVVTAFARAARVAGRGPVIVSMSATDTAAYPARLFPSADYLLIRLYDQHGASSPPGAIAEPDWVRRSLALRVAETGASRLVASLPVYGYVWRPNAATTMISYNEARRLATEAGVSLDRDPATATLHARRAGADGWELWISDAVLIDNLRRQVASLGVRRIAYWRLGLEDAALWTTIRR